jgi:hypothetical protein
MSADVCSWHCVTSIAGPHAVRNCMRDEGGPFEVGNQVLISSHCKLLSSKTPMTLLLSNTIGKCASSRYDIARGAPGRQPTAAPVACRALDRNR